MIKVSQLVDSQLSDFFRQEYPTFVKFFEEYYKATEIDGASVGLVRNIQKYQDADFYKDGIVLETSLYDSITATDTSIQLSSKTDNDGREIWKRFPSEGILLLDDGTNQEIIQYKSINAGLLTKVQRGASGTTKLGDLLVDSTFISTTGTAFDWTDTTVTNISHLFLAKLFKSLKEQYFSGIPIERLNEEISVPTILKYIKDFYASKGTSPAIEFLFRSAFNDEKILVRYPNEQLLKASESTWSIDTIVQGSLVKFTDGVTIDDLPGLVLKQITYGYDKNIKAATAKIEKAVAIRSGNETLYRIFLNAESVVGEFAPTNKTLSLSTFGTGNIKALTPGGQSSLVVDSTVGFPEVNGEFYVEGLNDALGVPIPFAYVEKTGTEFYDISTNAVTFPGLGTGVEIYGSNILYVVTDELTDPLLEGYHASFRPGGLVSTTPITGKGSFVKEGDVLEFGLSGKRQDAPINNTWRQNVTGRPVYAGDPLSKIYIGETRQVTRGVNQVFEDNDFVYVSSNGFPDTAEYIGNGMSASGPYSLLNVASQRHLKKIPKVPTFPKTKVDVVHDSTVGITIDGVPIASTTGTSVSASNEQMKVTGQLQSITVTNGGSGYTVSPKVEISGGGGAIATADIDNAGTVTRVNIVNNGTYAAPPLVTISAGDSAELLAVFNVPNRIGDIKDVTILNGGQNYTQIPQIVVIDESGRGRGAQFVVDSIDLSTGAILSIKRIASGYDYDKDKTKILVVPTGSGATAEAKVSEWHRDMIAKYHEFADEVGGMPFPGLLPEYHSTYQMLGNPVSIRKQTPLISAPLVNCVTGEETSTNILYDKESNDARFPDNIDVTGVEFDNDALAKHSPIVAWAYDGVPIYGPYGLADPLGDPTTLKNPDAKPGCDDDYLVLEASVRRMRSSYFIRDFPLPGRPSINEEVMGVFVEDYEYLPEGHELHGDLDEYNGRFCKPPEFPEGRYCYFLTISKHNDLLRTNKQSAQNLPYSKSHSEIHPRYPYVVGPKYKYNPILSNTTADARLENLPEGVIRIRDRENKLPQFGAAVNATVTNVSSGSVESVIIENGGRNYVSGNETIKPKWGVGDEFYIDNAGTQGAGFSAQVASILPKDNSGTVVNVSSIVANNITGTVDSRDQTLTIPGPVYNTANNTFTYNRISEGDIIENNSANLYTFRTAIDITEGMSYLLLREQSSANLSIGMSLEVGNEVCLINGVTSNNTRYAYLTMGTVEGAQSPTVPRSDRGFYYAYYNGSVVYDDLYIDIINGPDTVSKKVGKIIGRDATTKLLKVEMHIDPDTGTYHTINNSVADGSADVQVTTQLYNRPYDQLPRYGSLVSAVEHVKQVPIIRGYDGTTAISHTQDKSITNQAAKAVVKEYTQRLSVSKTTPGTLTLQDYFTPGVWIKGQASDCVAEVTQVTPDYIWVKNITQGPDASDIPRFGQINTGTGVFGAETISEISSGNNTNLIEAITNTSDSHDIKVLSTEYIVVNRYYQINNEIIKVVAKVDDQTLTVLRHQQGTSIPNSGVHLNSSSVTVVNGTATFNADEYYVTVNNLNYQEWNTSSTFLDGLEQTISITSTVTNTISATSNAIIVNPTNFSFFKLGNIIKVGTEKMLLNSVNQNMFYVTRGFENTTPAAHSDNTTITNISELQATVNTDITHNIIEGDLIEITGDPSSDTAVTNVIVKFDDSNNRFLFSSVHTSNTFESNPNLEFVYGHNYVFDVSHDTCQNKILAFWLDDTYTNSYAVDRNGVPGNANSTVTLKVTDKSIVNTFYNNANSLITNSNPRIRFIEDPYNISGTDAYNITATSFDYLIKHTVEGNARGTKSVGLRTQNVFGEIARVQVTNQGFGYEELPQIKGLFLRESDRIRYTITADDVTGEITNITVLYGGSRYINPKIYITGSGTGAKLTADTNGGTVRTITVNSGGTGYTSSGTKLRLVEEDDDDIRVLPSSSTIGQVLGIDITNPGSQFSNNYTMVPETTIPVSMQLIDLTDPKKFEYGEQIYQGNVNNPSVVGYVVDYNEINQTLRVRSVVGQYLVGTTITGYLSGTTATPKTVNDPSISSTISAITTISGFFSDDLGKLSTSSQNIQDSYFYQDFSYVIRSQIPVSDWREIIKDSTHPAGFLVFGEVILDSSASVATLPMGGATTCPPDYHRFTFSTLNDIQGDGSIHLTKGNNVKVGDAFRYYQDPSDGYPGNVTALDYVGSALSSLWKKNNGVSPYKVKWTGQTSLGVNTTVTGWLNSGQMYYVVKTEVDNTGEGQYIWISDRHPSDAFADSEHNRERLIFILRPTSQANQNIISTAPNGTTGLLDETYGDGDYYAEFMCDKENPQNQITVNIFKEFIDLDPTIPMKVTDGGRITEIRINKFFRMVERPGMGSLISAEGTVAINLAYIDDVTANIDGISKIYDIREQGSLISPYSDESLIVTLDGVTQEPGVAYTIINDKLTDNLEVPTTGAGPLEFDSWKITTGTTNINNGSTTVSNTADISNVYLSYKFGLKQNDKEKDFVYVKSKGIPSYTATLGPYSGLTPSFQDMIKRVPTTVFAPVDKETTPLGIIGILCNGVLLQNPRLDKTYNDKGKWTTNETGSQPPTDIYGGKSNLVGNYYHTANPIGLRRQLKDNITLTGNYAEDFSSPIHSPILGWCFDGTPIYGPYGYTDPTSATSAIKKIDSGYSKRAISVRNVLADGTILSTDDIGPPVNSVEFKVLNFIHFTGTTYNFSISQQCNQVTSGTDDTIVTGVSGTVHSWDPIEGKLLLTSTLGAFTKDMWIKTPTAWAQISSVPFTYQRGYFVEDYEYSSATGDLDEYNGRFTVTPEFPEGRYCYFMTIDGSNYDYSASGNSAEGNSAYPYAAGPKLFHKFYPENQLSKAELSSKIIFAEPPKEFSDSDTGHEQTAKFTARSFGFSDANNNQNYVKKYKNISYQFDNYKSTFALDDFAEQPANAPADALEASEQALVFLDGIIQIPGKSYTINDVSNTITFTKPPARTGKIINMSEIVDVLNFRDNETITGATSGAVGRIVSRTPLGYEGKGVLKVEVLKSDFIDGENITAPAIAASVVQSDPNLNKAVTNATYDKDTGDLTLSLGGTHTFNVGSLVHINYESLTFKCLKDNYQTEHKYPRITDPAFNQNLNITAVDQTAGTITCNVGIDTGGDKYEHLFVRAANPAIKIDGSSAARSAISTPCKLVGTVVAKDRFLDAANLLEANKDLIAEEAVLAMKDYPAYKVPNLFEINSGIGGFTNQDCIDDVKDVISAIVDNIRYGGNDKVWEAADLYVNGGALQHLVGEEEPSNLAMRWAKDLCVLAMQNKLNDYNTIGSSTGYSTYDNAATNKMIDGANLLELNKDLIANEAVERMLGYPGNEGFSVPYHKSNCVDDIKDALDCMIFNMTYGGNNKTWDAANFFATGRHVVDGMTGPSNKFTPTGATYDSTNGNLVLTIGDHDLVVGSKVKIADAGLTFSCTMDGNTANKTYPRQVDPYYRRAIDVTAVGSTDHTIESGTTYNPSTGVLTAKVTGHNFKGRTSHTAATGTAYNPTTGILTVTTTANHNLVNGDKVVIADNSLTFTCTHGTGNHTYPRQSDPVSGKWLTVSNVTADTFQVQVLFTLPSTNITTHTFVSATTDGITKIGDRVLISDNSLTFTCGKDAHQTNHTYPRTTDPWSGKWLEIYNQTTDTFDVQVGISSNTSSHTFVSATANGLKKQDGTITLNVGSSPTVNYTPTGGSYEPTSGVLSLTIGQHGIRVGDSIKLATDSISFDCGAGSGTKTYPRANGTGGATADDPAYNTAVTITGVGSTDHTVESGTTYNAETGVLTVKITGHNFNNGDRVKFTNDSLTFTCLKDNHATQHTYPRATDPKSNQWLAISNKTTDTFDVQVGVGSYTKAHTFVSATTNGLQKQDGTITMNVGTSSNTTAHTYVTAAADAVIAGGNYTHTFVTASTDSLITGGETKQVVQAYNAAKDISSEVCRNILVDIKGSHGFTQHTNATITDSSIGTFTPTGATYDPTSGEMILTVDNHGLTTANSIEIDTDSLEFTCSMDSNATKHTYPRASDPANSKGLKIVDHTTNTITVNVGTTSLKTYDITDADYNKSTGDMEITIGNHDLLDGSGIKLAPNSITFTCTKDFNVTQHSYPRTTDPYYDKSIKIKSIGKTNYNVTDAEYDPETGIASLTTSAASNYFTGPSLHTADSATYNPLTGDLTISMLGHNLKSSDMIKIAPHSFFFTCTMDAGATQHSYPRATDPSANKWLPVYNVTTTAFTVNVGASPVKGYNVTGSTYDPATGNLVMTVGNHNLQIGTSIRFGKDALTFTCGMDSNGSNHTYPRSTDPYYNKSVNIISKTSDSITVNVGTTPLVNHNVTGATYNPTTGQLVLTIGTHTLTVGESIRIATDSLKFSCGHGGATGAAAEKTYPRASGSSAPGGADYAYNTALQITHVDNNSITVDANGGVGTISNLEVHTFVSADPGAVISGGNYPHTFVTTSNTFTPTAIAYNPTTGYMTVNIGNHKFGNGDHIRIADNSLSFTCTQGSGLHTYPRATDPASGRWLPIENVTATTFDVKVLDVVPSTNTTTHTFVSATANCIERAVVSTGGNYPHTFVGTLANAIEKATQFVQLADNSLTFTCAMDNHATNHTYPRSSDPYSGRWLPVSKAVGSTVDVQIGASPNKSKHTFVSGASNGISVQNGKITINVGTASLSTDHYDHTFVSATTGALITGGNYAHTFSSAKTNCITSRIPLPKLAPTDAVYNPATGDMQITVKNHGLTTNDRITIAPDSMIFTCDMDDNSTEHAYPRKSDPASKAVLPVKTINTSDVFTVSVGTTPNVSHNVSNADYDHQTGDLVLTLGDHSLNTGQSIKIADNALTFTCTKAAGNHTYPRTTIINKDITGADYNAVTGIMTITSVDHGFENGETVKIADNSITMTCGMDGDTSQKTYPRSTDPISGKWMTVSNKTNDTFDINVGKSPLKSFTPGPGTSYDPNTGLVVLHIGPHSLKVGDSVRLASMSLDFTCAKDNHATIHSYPRVSDPEYQTATSITAITDHTITIQALASIPSTNTDVHIFKKATAGAVTSGGNYSHTFVSASANAISHKQDRAYDAALPIIADGVGYTVSGADYNPITGWMTISVTNHLFNNGDRVKFLRNSLTFKCTKDATQIPGQELGVSLHTYPRATDPADSKWLTISNKTIDTFDVFVGKSSDTSKHTWVSSTTNGLIKHNGQITINVGVAEASEQYPHTFISATAGAVISGGNYSHTFVSAYSNAISVLGYDTNDCADVVSAIATLNGIITNAVTDPKSIKSVVRTTPNAYPIRYSTRSLVTDNSIAIDPASRNYTSSCADVASSISTLLGIVVNTIDDPTSLAKVTKTDRRSYIEKEGIFQSFFAYSNGKYSVLDQPDTSAPTTTFVMRLGGKLTIPNISQQVIVVVNGVVQEYGSSYVINESLVEFYKPILAGSDLQIFYWYGRDLQKILKGYNVPLYEPSYIKRNSLTGQEILHTTENGSATNKRIRSLPLGAYPLVEFFRLGDKIQIDGELDEREIVDLTNRDIVEWEKLEGTNTFSINAATDIVGSPTKKIYFENYQGQTTSGFINGTKVVYDNNGNSDISGLTNGTTYYLGYTYTDKSVSLYDSYLKAIGGGTDNITINVGSGIHKFAIATDLSGLKQTQFKTSDYTGITRGREASFTARVRFTMVLSNSANYTTPGTVIFSGGQSVATVIQDLGSNKIEVQVQPDRDLADGVTVSTDIQGTNAVTMTSKENGYIYAIESLSGSFPTGLDYDTAPVIVIKPAFTDTGGFAKAHAEIDQNSQIARVIVDEPGANYFQVPEILVTRAYKHITQTYPLALVRNQYNFWSSFDTKLNTICTLDAKELTVSFDNTITTTPVKRADLGQQITIYRGDEMTDGIDQSDVSKTYDYLNPTDNVYPNETAADMPNVTSVGRLRLQPTFQALEENKFNVDTTLTIGSIDARFGGLRISDVSDRFYSSVYDDKNVAGVQSIRFDATPHTMIREFAGKIAANVSVGDTYIPLEGIFGFNYMRVEGNTFWLTEDMAIYEERTFVIIGYVDKVIDSNTFIIRMNVGQNLLSGTNISNVANTVMVSIASQVYGELETGKERLAYDQIDWTSKWLMLTQPCTKAYTAGEFVRTAQPIRLGST